MRQRHLETFFAVMTYGTVTQAAARLGVTQPSVTSTLRQAEKELGFQLFDRAGGRLTPTTEARTIYDEAARAHASLAAIRNLCQQLRKGEATQLRVVATQTLTDAILPEAIEQFAADKSGYDIAASTLSSNAILESFDVRRDDCDIGFIFGDRGDHGVYTVHIGDCPLFCVMQKQMSPALVTRQGKFDFTQLHQQPFIALNETEPVGRAGHTLFLKAGIEPETHIRAQNHRLAGELALRGLGFALLDIFNAAAVAENAKTSIVAMEMSDAAPIPVHAALARANSLDRTARRFIEIFTSEFQNKLGEARKILAAAANQDKKK